MTDSLENSETLAAIARLGDDDSSSLGAPLRRIGNHPYRDGRDALVDRRRAVESELRALEPAEQRAARLRAQLRTLDEELDGLPDARLLEVTRTSSCRAPWSEMLGGGAARRCGRCRRDVFDPAQMSTREIDALLARVDALPGTELRRRRDGRLVSSACPGERSAAKSALQAVGAITVATVVATATLGTVAIVGVALANPIALDDAEIAARARGVEVRRGERVLVSTPPRDPAVITRALTSRGVRATAAHTWEIDRALARRVLDGSVSLSDTLSIAPRIREGRVDGLRLLQLRDDDLLARLGFRNGDTVLAINEHPLASPHEVALLLEDLRYRDRFAVLLERRGESLIQVYDLVGPRER